MTKRSWEETWKRHAYHSRGWLGWMAPLLLPATGVYSATTRARRMLYRNGWLASAGVHAPSIAVGNLTVGGVGKTPFTQWLAQALGNQGAAPGVVLRGYKRESREALVALPESITEAMINSVGDEAALYVMRSRVPVAVTGKRIDGAKALLDQTTCDVLLLDDAFQHIAFQRDVDLVLVDGSNPFGNEFPLPYGPLREPMAALKHCDAIIVRGEVANEVVRECERPVFCGTLRWKQITPFVSWKNRESSPGAQSMQECVMLSGIGSPERLEHDAREWGLTVVSHHAFSDHHWFTADDLEPLFHKAKFFPIVTTEKDAIRLCALSLPEVFMRALHVIEAEWLMHDEAAFLDWLREDLSTKNKWPWPSA